MEHISVLFRARMRDFFTDWRLALTSGTTSIRVFSTAVLIVPYAHGYGVAFVVLAVILALTDWIDGHLATTLGRKTQGGAMLDIIADKVFCVTLMSFGLDYWSFAWYLAVPYALLFVYHAGVLSIRIAGKILFKSSVVAKTKMFVEMTGLIAIFAPFAHPGLGIIFVPIGLGCIWIATLLALWSLAHYAGWLPDMAFHRFMPARSRA